MSDILTGYVIKTNDVKDNDVILSVYTKEYGVVSLYARGIKKSTSKNAFACQLFDYSEFLIEMNQMKSMQLLKSATLKKEFLGIRSDYDRLSLASVVIELAGYLEEDNIFDLLDTTLKLLDSHKELFTVFELFVVRYLDLLGLSPEVDGCVLCGDTRNIETISVSDGGFVCRNCNRQLHLKPRDAGFLKNFRIINKASFEVLDKIEGLGLNEYRLSALLMEFLMTHSGLTVRSWRSVSGSQ